MSQTEKSRKTSIDVSVRNLEINAKKNPVRLKVSPSRRWAGGAGTPVLSF